MNNKGNLTDERPPLLPVIIGTGFGSGFWPWGPGTAGSVLATLIWAALAYGLGITGESFQSILQKQKMLIMQLKHKQLIFLFSFTFQHLSY